MGTIPYTGFQSVYLLTTQNTVFAIPDTSIILSWPVVVYDDLKAYSGETPRRITIPFGMSRARFCYALDTQAAAASQLWTVELLKNGSSYAQLGQVNIPAGNYGVWQYPSAKLLVKAGDYFEIRINFTSTVFQGTLVAGTANLATHFTADFA